LSIDDGIDSDDKEADPSPLTDEEAAHADTFLSETEALHIHTAADFWDDRQACLDDTSAKFNNKGDHNSNAAAREFHKIAGELPYLTPAKRGVVDCIGELIKQMPSELIKQMPMAVLPDDPVGVRLTKKQSDAVDSLPEPFKKTLRQACLDANQEIAARDQEIAARDHIDEIRKHIGATAKATRVVQTQLQVISGLSESDGTMGTNTRDVMSEVARRAKKVRPNENLPPCASPQQIYEKVTKEWKPIKPYLSLNGACSAGECVQLQRMANHLDKHLSCAEFHLMGIEV
jgi:hypothetical protein